MTNPQHNATDQANGTPLLDGYPWKSTHDWVSALPPMLNGRGAEDKVAQRVLLNLSSKADHRTGRNAYPSNAWLAERCHVSERSVRSALLRLEEGKRIERDGLSRHGTVRWRMRFELDVPAAWLPLDAREERKRDLAAERQRRRRAKLISEAKCVTGQPDTSSEQELTSEAECVTEPVDLGSQVRDIRCVTHLASDNQSFSPPVEETSQLTTDVAAAPPAGLDVIDAELVDEKPPTELVPAAGPPAVADLSASWLLAEPEETGTRKRKAPVDAPRWDATKWQEPREQHTPSEWTRMLVGLYVDHCRQAGFEPSGRQIGQVGKEVKGLVASGNNPVHILAAVRRAADRRQAWVLRAMADVEPGNWAAARPGPKQMITAQGVVRLPEGITNSQRRHLSIRAAAEAIKARTA